jgi:hypothetical protein
MKTLNKAYVEQNWETYKQHYNDTAKIRYNVTKGNEASLEDAIKQFKEDHATFSAIQYLDKETFYEMVITDDDETWVNFWGVWIGTLKATDQKFEVPLHITARFVDGKVVEEHGYWNNTDIVLAIRESVSSK